MSEQINIAPNPEIISENPKPKFPTKQVRNVLIAATAVAITIYVAQKVRSNDEEEDSDTSSEA